jgi:hypothetical protein
MKALPQDNPNILIYFRRQLSFASSRYILPIAAIFMGIRLFMDHEGKGILFAVGNSTVFFPVSFLLIIIGFTRLSKSFNAKI